MQAKFEFEQAIEKSLDQKKAWRINQQMLIILRLELKALFNFEDHQDCVNFTLLLNEFLAYPNDLERVITMVNRIDKKTSSLGFPWTQVVLTLANFKKDVNKFAATHDLSKEDKTGKEDTKIFLGKTLSVVSLRETSLQAAIQRCFHIFNDAFCEKVYANQIWKNYS